MSLTSEQSEREVRVDLRPMGGSFEAARALWAAATS
jgi:hypothetical protein